MKQAAHEGDQPTQVPIVDDNMLREAVRKLEGYDRARAEFIDNVSHELRTPLATMSYTTANLLKGILGPLPEQLRAYLVMFGEECDSWKILSATLALPGDRQSWETG